MINQAVWLRSGLCHKRAGTNAVLGQALGNLLSNAIKYTPPGGTVTISANVENGLTAIHVEDTGAGIAQDEQALVFTPFYRGGADGRFP